VKVLTRTSVCTVPFSFPLANDFLNLRLILYELKSSKGKRFNDKDVKVLTETSVYSEPFSVFSYYQFTESTRDYF
jgi:hypothetical protein